MACYPYESGEIGDLIFTTGEIVLVTKKDGDWWTGVIDGTRIGIFPSNYVQKTTERPQIMSSSSSSVQQQQQQPKEIITTPTSSTSSGVVIKEQTQTSAAAAPWNSNGSSKVISPISSEFGIGKTMSLTEEAKTQAEADSEVSEINQQPIQIPNDEQIMQEYNRPMSTSSMTPVSLIIEPVSVHF